MSEEKQEEVARWGDSTAAVHAGTARPYCQHSLTLPVYQTATYTFEDTQDLKEFMDARMWGLQEGRIEYGRYGNPTIAAVESKLAALERAEEAILFSSGMAAITSTLLTMLSSGDHLILTDDCYRRTRQFCHSYLKRMNIDVSIVPAGNFSSIESAVSANTKLILSELPTNPYLRVVDLEKLVDIGSKNGIRTAIDSTFATPINLRPFEIGVDFVFHSATKYLGGHNDLLAGVCVGSASLLAMVRQNQWMMGAVSDPHTAYLLDRGLKTLALRVRHHNAAAQAISEFLNDHPRVERVWYPGLNTHPDHEVAARQMSGFGGVVSFEIRGDLENAARCIDAVELPIIAPSLGGAETLIEQPALMSYFELSTEERMELGIKDNLVRLSIGLEDPQDLIDDLDQALKAL
ncbi:MAG: aminotransferase class I/II-fold pyridoxal phosphate-dependent enzyme [Anaerolineales bacterium]|nr:aminotransferase class I/II-fold pyridoxal phosphate-dependent enzyme [Anaerolineales bacterium]